MGRAINDLIVSDTTERVTLDDNSLIRIDANGLFYRNLNILLRDTLLTHQPEKIIISNVCGQRYIGTNLRQPVKVEILGIPGNDLGAFMDGPRIEVFGNAQDGSGNTMNSGEIIIHGDAGDILGFSARGGEIFVKGNVGYRVGIHMKEYKRKVPNIVIGGVAGDFLAEYMAGGVVLVLGLPLAESERCKARFVGTGMHGGVIYERGDILEVGKGTKIMKVGKRDMQVIESLVKEYCEHFGVDFKKVMSAKFHKIVPLSKRPYGAIYST